MQLDHPRVLLVSASAFNPYTGGGITLTNLFKGWPADRIATAHSEVFATHDSVCWRFYRLSSRELSGFWPFRRLMRPGARSPGGSAPGGGPASAPSSRPGLRTLVTVLDRLLAGSGLRDSAWVSPELRDWLLDFRPQLIYTILGSLGFIRLARQISALTRAPIVVHMMDDWPATRYRRGLLGPLLCARMERELRSLLAQCPARLGICEPMCQEYRRRYGLPFLPFHNVLDVEQWTPHMRRDWRPRSPARIVYAGSVLPNAQLESLRDLARAVRELRAEGLELEMRIHSSHGLQEPYRALLENPPAVTFAGALHDDSVGPALSEADVLLLPVNFDPRTAAYVRYSFPTKIPAYLFSGTPILAYGPASVAQIQMAREEGWARVVPRNVLEDLKQALRDLTRDGDLRGRLGRRAQEVALRDHAAERVRPRFQEVLTEAAGSLGDTPRPDETCGAG